MKKVLSVIAVSAFVMTAGVAVAGGPGKKKDAACPEACQQQIDDLQSSQAQQNEMLGAHGKQLENHEGRITALEKDAYDPWFVRVGVRAAWASMTADNAGNRGGYDADTDAGFGGGFAVGREFGQFRVEGEFGYQGSDVDIDQFPEVDADYDLYTVMVNGYYEIPVYDAFSIYAMAGVGVAKLTVDYGDGWDESDQTFAYKAGVGVTYNFTDQIAADLGYEYLGLADTDVADSISGHNIVGSVRFKF